VNREKECMWNFAEKSLGRLWKKCQTLILAVLSFWFGYQRVLNLLRNHFRGNVGYMILLKRSCLNVLGFAIFKKKV
jgi:hypothetical protein